MPLPDSRECCSSSSPGKAIHCRERPQALGDDTSEELGQCPSQTPENAAPAPVLGRPFTVESDHKPLEMIHQKSLASAPPRLQRMLLQLQWYDMVIRYKPGKEMLLADAMSRYPSHSSEEIKLDMRVDYIAFQQGLDCQTKGSHMERPHSEHSVPAHPAGVATPKKAHSPDGQGILGLQR